MEEPLRALEGYRFGIELELNGEQSLGRVLRWFDIRPALRAKREEVIQTVDWGSYLTPEKLETLPEPWRSSVITESLEVRLHYEEGKKLLASDGTLLTSPGNGRGESVRAVLGTPGATTTPGGGPAELVTGFRPPSGMELRGGLLVPKTTAPKAPAGTSEVSVPHAIHGVPETGAFSGMSPGASGMSSASGIPGVPGALGAKEEIGGINVDSSVRARLAHENAVKRFQEKIRSAPSAEVEALARSDWFDPNSLTPEEKVALFKSEGIRSADLVPRADLPPRVAGLLRRLEWVRDMNALEFRHKKPLESANAMIEDLHLLAEQAGITRFLENPAETEPNTHSFSYHLNISRKGSEADSFARELNRLQIALLQKQGRGENYLTTHDYLNGFSSSVGTKGIIRSHEGRWEIRAHVEEPREEILRMAKYLGPSGARHLRDEWNLVKHHQAEMLRLVQGSKNASRGLGLFIKDEWHEDPARQFLREKVQEQSERISRGTTVRELYSGFDFEARRIWNEQGDGGIFDEYLEPVLQKRLARMAELVKLGSMTREEFIRDVTGEMHALQRSLRYCEKGKSCAARRLVKEALAASAEGEGVPRFLSSHSALFWDKELGTEWNRILGENLASPQRGAWALLALSAEVDPSPEVLKLALRGLRPEEVKKFLDYAPRWRGREGVLSALRLYGRVPASERAGREWDWLTRLMKNFVKHLYAGKEEAGRELARHLAENTFVRRGNCAARFSDIARR